MEAQLGLFEEEVIPLVKKKYSITFFLTRGMTSSG